ncbi:MAG: biotin/lipoyl-binding protein [Fibromonadaceae bacterium]|jgi:biotin carboxyl carrier protein|nr:biotin/lipoyl-binding protein [Fibromonadaceae bacterium]
MKTLRITLEGKTYDVAVEVLGESKASAPAVQLVAAAPSPAVPSNTGSFPALAARDPAPAAAAAGAGSVLSPMAGQVMKIKVAVGTAVSANQEVVVLEAMKMETPIYAPAAGTVQAISVKEGEAVAEGQVLLTIG